MNISHLQLGLPKPTKQTRPNLIRRREIRRKDKKLSKETETNICQKCGRPGKTDPAHIKARRHQETRHSPENIIRKCRWCHSMEHLGAKVCCRCKKEKPASAFWRDYTRDSGLYPICIACKSA